MREHTSTSVSESTLHRLGVGIAGRVSGATTITGVAEFDLDLVGGGVGASLRHASAKSSVGTQTA